MLGDIFLDLKYVYRNDDKPYTFAGFIAFGIGHILYITGMFLEFYHGENVLYVILPIAIGVAGGIINVFLEKPGKTYHILAIVAGGISCSGLLIAGGILGLIASRHEEQNAQPQVKVEKPQEETVVEVETEE